jgi:predicted N-acetyltransferase YhbS
MTAPRPATADDLTGIIDLLDTIFRREKGVTDQSVLTDFPLLFAEENLENCRVIEQHGRIVSHAAVWPRTLDFSGQAIGVGIIVLVATEAQSRRRGLAAELMRDLQAAMPGLGCQLGLLWTGVPEFYQPLGWQTVNTPGWIASPSDTTNDRDHLLQVVDFDPPRHLDAIHQLHQSHTHHSRRTLHESAHLFSLPKCPVLVGESDGQAVAYLVDAQATNKRGLIEYAGGARDVWELVQHVVADRGPRRLLVFPTHAELADWAREAGWSIEPLGSSKGSGDARVRVLDETLNDSPILRQLFCWGLDQA